MAQAIEYELTKPEADLLLAAMIEVNELAGEVGGILGAQPGWAKENGKVGAAGGRFGVRFTRPRSAAATVDLPLAPADAHERARAGLTEMGTVIENPNGAADGSLWALVGSGWGNLLPALVRVDVEPTAGGSRLRVRATGREGLIKQKIAPKAVDRLVEAVSSPAA